MPSTSASYSMARFTPSKETVWRKVLNSPINQALITLTGMDFAPFADLLMRGFKPYYEEYTPFMEDESIQKQDKIILRGQP